MSRPARKQQLNSVWQNNMADNKTSYIEPDTNSGIIAWFARNSVAANLLMIFILVAGAVTAFTSLRKQMFPQIEASSISINVAYPGAAPRDVEENIAIRIEEALEGIQGLDRVLTFSRRNSFSSYIRVDEKYDVQEVLDEIKIQIDGISSFPDGMERPIVTARKYRQEVMYLSLYGDLTNRQLKDLGEEIYREIQALPVVNISEYYDGLAYEISIEVSKDKLREYNMGFNDIANAVRQYSTNVSAGQIKAADGYITVRAETQAYVGNEFESLPIKTLADGSQILLSDVATVHDDFEDGTQYLKFNGENSVYYFIGASADQDITDVAKAVKKYLEEKSERLPEGVYLESWVDFTYYLNGRLNMMVKNMIQGGILVFLILALFLKFKLAFWVILGLPVAFFGTLLFMPTAWIDVTLNVTSIFGFIMVLGIVVDDAIVIGESINSEIEQKGHSVDNVIRGAKRVAMPATFGVLTTIAAFGPMIFATGPDAAFSQSIGFVVILCLLFSLVESKLILPAHIVQMKESPEKPNNLINRLRNGADKGMKSFVENTYRPLIKNALEFRYFVLVLFLAVAAAFAGMYEGQLIRFTGAPKIPHDFPNIMLEMEDTATEQTTLAATQLIEQAVLKVDEDLKAQYGTGMIESIYVSLESRTKSEITVKLIDPELRPINTFEVSDLWRKSLPPLPGKKTLTINDNLFGNEREDGDLSFKFVSHNPENLSKATDKIKSWLEGIEGVGDVNDSRQSSSKEIQFELKPVAYAMGLSVADVASQMNFSLYGLEAQRILRNSEEIKVMVRYPEDQRNSVGLVDDILIRTPSGAEVPLVEIAEVQNTQGVSQIRREDGKQTVTVWATVDRSIITPMELQKEMKKTILPSVQADYPGIYASVSGKLKREMEGNQKQMRDMIITLMVIYILLAIPLKSYVQPLIIMSVIPFGIIGSVLGHIIFGEDLSSLSVFGIIAAAGVVINDSLVMVDFINKAKLQGFPLRQAVVDAGSRRFRAIVLTSLTTFIGLFPIIMEPSMQAKIVIPMALSLAFGVLFATVVTLILTPCLYFIGTDIKAIALSTLRYAGISNRPESIDKDPYIPNP